MSTDLDLTKMTLLDSDISDCPYDAYGKLRDEAPVWRDNATGMYVITRYDDVRMVLSDTERFTSARHRGRVDPRSAKIKAMYEKGGWVPGATLAGRDDPEHREMRGLFNHAFRPSRIKEMDPFIEELAHQLIDKFIDDGRCDWVRSFAIPLPLIVIGRQMGARDEDMWQIKAWTDAWVQRLGMMQTDEEAFWSTEQEIEAQHYFQPIFERLRQQPDNTLLSDLVNTVVPEWGRTLTDNELHAEMMADTFVGGSETTTNALSEGVRLLIANPDQWSLLKSDPDKYVPLLVEEVLRLEGPVQGLFRSTTQEIVLHGVTIPAGQSSTCATPRQIATTINLSVRPIWISTATMYAATYRSVSERIFVWEHHSPAVNSSLGSALSLIALMRCGSLTAKTTSDIIQTSA